MRNILFAVFALAAIGAVTWMAMSKTASDDEAPTITTWNESDVENVEAPEVEIVDGLDNLEIGGGRSEVTVDGPGASLAPGSELQLSVFGRVVDVDGQPVADASVRLEVAQRRFGRGGRGTRDQRVRKTVTTGIDGEFEFAGPGTTQSRIQLVVQHESFAPLLVDQRVENAEGRCAIGDVTVIRGAALVGRVTNQDGQGIAMAEVRLEPRDGNRLAWSSARGDVLEPLPTDSLGFYRFEHVMPGNYRVAATARGLQRGTLRAPVRLDDGEEEEADAIVLQPGAILGGTVFDPEGKPLAGAEVRIRAERDRGHDTKTGTDGKFEFENLPARTLEVSVEADGFLTWTQADIDPNAPPGGGAGMIVQLDRGLTLEGRVVDAASGTPVSTFAAKLERIRGIDRGGDANPMEAMLAEMRRRMADVDPARAREIEARITDRMRNADRNAVDGQRRNTNRWWGRQNRQPEDLGPVTSHENGQFRFDGLDEGVYVVYIGSPDHQVTKTTEVEVRREGAPPPAVVSVERGVFLSGVVSVAGTDRPVEGARVELLAVREEEPPRGNDGPPGRPQQNRGGRNGFREMFRPSGPRGDRVLRMNTDASGGFEFAHAKPGEYFVRVEVDGFSDFSTEPFRLERDRDDLAIDILPTARISGIVSGRSGDEPVRVLAFAGFGRGRMQDVPVAEDGSYVIEDAQPGSYVLRAFTGDLRSYVSTAMQRMRSEEMQPDVVVEAGGAYELNLVVDVIPVGAVTGTIFQNGQPGDNLRVRLSRVDAQNGGGFGGRGGWGRGSNTATADSEGKFDLERVTTGTYRLSVLGSGRSRNELWSEEIVVVDGATSRVDIQIVSGTLKGTVNAPEGAPSEQLGGTISLLPGATEMPENLRDYERENPSQRIRVSNGEFAQDGIRPGPALIVLRIRGREPVSIPVDVLASETTLTLMAGALSENAIPPTNGGPGGGAGGGRPGGGTPPGRRDR